jgi:pSer/pThr/pTyr-binding forkhead associated (FHA) protein
MAEKRPSLTVLGGPMAGTKFVLEEGVRDVLVGSSESCQFRIDLDGVSPLHAHLKVDAAGVNIEDAGSEKGLHVNDSPVVGSVPLRNGDIVWLGTPGETDVVMLQCILPRMVSAPAAPPPEPVAPEPIPIDEETLALGPDTLEDAALAATMHMPAKPTRAEPPAVPGAVDPEPVDVEPTVADAAPASSGLTYVEDTEAPPTVAYAPAAPLSAEPSPAFFEDETEETVAHPPTYEEETPATVVMAAEDVADVSMEPTFVMPAPSEDPLVTATEAESTFVMPDGDEPSIPFKPEPPEPYTESEPTVLTSRPVEEELAPTMRAPMPELPSALPPKTTVLPRPTLRPTPPAAPPPAPTPPASAPATAPTPAPSRSGAYTPAAGTPAAGTPAAGTPAAAPRRPAPSPRPAPRPSTPRAEPAAAPPRRASSTPVGLYAGIAVAVIALGGGAFYMLSRRSSAPPQPPPTQVAQLPTPAPAASVAPPPETTPAAEPSPTPPETVTTPEPAPATPTPAPVAATPTTTLKAAPSPSPTPSPKATPTPKATPSTSAKAPPTTAAPAPSAEALRAQQIAAQVASLLGQADGAMTAHQYDAAIGHFDEALKLDPGNAKATADRASAVSLRDASRKKFVPGRTVVKTEKAQDGLAGFDGAAVQKAPDFLGRIEFDISPASGMKAGDAYSLKFFLVNEGKKSIKVSGLTATTTVNGSGAGAPLPAKVKEVEPQQRALVAELPGVWKDGTSSWSTELLLTANKGDSLRNSLTWR